MRISDWSSDVCSSDLIQVVDVDLAGDRHLILHHKVMNGVLLAESDAAHVLQHLADLWTYDVCMKEVDSTTGKMLNEHRARPRPLPADGSEEQMTELQYIMRNTSAVFC